MLDITLTLVLGWNKLELSKLKFRLNVLQIPMMLIYVIEKKFCSVPSWI